MDETSTTAMLVGTRDMLAEQSSALTATLSRDDIEGALASEPPDDLILEILRSVEGQRELERRMVNVAWDREDLESVLSDADADEVAELNALHGALASAIALHHFGADWLRLPTKAGRLDWSLGEAVATVKRKTGADYAFFSWIRDSYASGERVAMMIALALLFATVGRPFTPAEVGEVQPGSPAEAAGLLPGDRILAVDGEATESFEELQAIVRERPEQTLSFTIERADETLDLPITPKLTEITDRFGQVHRIGLIGVSRSGVEFRRADPVFAVVEGVGETFYLIGGTLHALGQMVIGSRTTEELGGPLRIAQMSGEIAKDGAVPVIWFTAVLSINLGLINLFPIPLLDGGHLVMYAIEAVRGRPLTERSQEMAFRFGLMVVITLMVVATWNDVVHLDFIGWIKGLVS